MTFSLALGVRRARGNSTSQVNDSWRPGYPCPIVSHYLEQGNTVICIDDEKFLGRLKTAYDAHLFEQGAKSHGLMLLPVSRFGLSNELTGEKLWRKCRQLSKSVANPDKRKGVTIVKNGTAIATELGSVDKLIGLQSEFIQYSREKEATELGIDKIIGMFNAETILQMGAAQLVRVMANHNFMIGWTNPSTETRCNSDMIFRCISRGINKVLGPGSDHLIYKTLQSVYKMKIEDIESRPDIFAVKLVKLLANSAETVLRSIANELQTEIFALTE